MPGEVYVEDEARIRERDEAQSLRMALEELDLEEEQRIFRAAQDEATGLVRAHQSPKIDTRPRMPAETDGTASMREARQPHATATTDTAGSAATTVVRKKKSYQELANAVATDIANIKRRVSSGGKRIVSGGRRRPSGEKAMFPTLEDKIYEEAIPEEDDPKTRGGASMRPSIILPVAVTDDHLAQEIPRHIRKNPFARVRFNKDNLERQNSVTQPSKFNPIEIQKNPPTQSRKPWYTSNANAAVNATEVPPMTREPHECKEQEVKGTAKNGMEIRSEDIRSATSMKRKDQSRDLPQPTAVSGRPDRPIVSFDNNWKQREHDQDSGSTFPAPSASTPLPGTRHSPSGPKTLFGSKRQAGPSSRDARSAGAVAAGNSPHSAPATVSIPNGIPTIILPDDDGVPSKVLSEEPEIPQPDLLLCKGLSVMGKSVPVLNPMQTSIPVISVDDTEQVSKDAPARPLPRPARSADARPQARQQAPRHANNVAYQSAPQQRKAALCAQCALPIAGRVLTAAGERFHPGCFACHQCGINLECVAFYPEPDKKYYERIARIQHRMQGLEIAMPQGATQADALHLEELDGDESLRFFCHLDFHETFSPRCKSCKTPIEGEVVVACGSEWHVGHFFCAQCGDVSCITSSFGPKD